MVVCRFAASRVHVHEPLSTAEGGPVAGVGGAQLLPQLLPGSPRGWAQQGGREHQGRGHFGNLINFFLQSTVFGIYYFFFVWCPAIEGLREIFTLEIIALN